MFAVKVYKYLPPFCIPLVYLCYRSYPYKNMVRCLTPGVGLSIPPVAPADVPSGLHLFHQRHGDFLW